MTFDQAIADSTLFPFFHDARSWARWVGILKAISGSPMTPEEFEFFTRCSLRLNQPARAFAEVLIEVGRRGGKTIIAAFIGVVASCLRDYSAVLAPGERGVVLLVAADKAQAGVAFRYVFGFLKASPMFARLIERKTLDTIDLSNGVSIEVRTASFRTLRGRTIVCCICDELAFWRDETSANPDAEILAAVRGGMASIPSALLFMITTLHGRRGVTWEIHRKFFGVEDDHVLVLRADSLSMNPTLPASLISRAFEEDEAVAWSEYGRDGEIRFRSDVENIVPFEVIAAAVDPGCWERGYVAGKNYVSFADPAGGSGSDSMVMAIAHSEADMAVLDLIREVRPPFSPETVCRDFAEVLKAYNIRRTNGDAYAGTWPAEGFARHGIVYEPNAEPKSRIYERLLPRLNSGQVRLLDNERLKRQIVALERRTSRGSKDSIDHRPGAHDDVCNAAAGALVLAAGDRAAPGFCFIGTGTRSRSDDDFDNARDID